VWFRVRVRAAGRSDRSASRTLALSRRERG
jgi:hypothetical protein